MNFEDFISEALCYPSGYISYFVSRRLAQLYPDKALVESNACAFNLHAFARAGQCSLIADLTIHYQEITDWGGSAQDLLQEAQNGWFNVLWQDNLIDVLLISILDDGYHSRHHWVLADSKEVAESFFRAVCRWNTEVRSEILVYDGGRWCKSVELFESIKTATFDNLILPAAFRQEIQNDLANFFASREVYERYGIPWKRGVLLIGPPGNGKTHTVKALINQAKQPCLYVKSFKSNYGTEHDNIRAVFARARHTTPSVVVLEDLDSLIDEKSRSFFLNELDGFALNTGVVVLATTNHPERLDPAILDRPSRFDRKYYFALPAEAERLAYVARWNATLEADLKMSEPLIFQVAEQTEGFSFAYMKELFLSSMMQWIARPEPGGMDGCITDRVKVLREQMAAMNEAPSLAVVTDDDDTD